MKLQKNICIDTTQGTYFLHADDPINLAKQFAQDGVADGYIFIHGSILLEAEDLAAFYIPWPNVKLIGLYKEEKA